MKTIELTYGKVTLVDDEDFEMLSQWKWSARVPREPHLPWYARRKVDIREDGPRRKKGEGRRKVIRYSNVSMHRLIMQALSGQEVDHINRDGLDNRRCNLRFATRSEQMFNATMKTGATGHRGITFKKREGMFIARVGGNNSRWDGRITVARTKTLEEAVAKREEFMRGVSA